jgi:hypothetical protein
MVVSKIFGGLGNQLFCYAAARSLAIKTGSKLYLDLYSGFRKDFYRRTPAIQLFNVQYAPASRLFQFQYPGGVKVSGALRFLSKQSDVVHRHYYFERDFSRYDEGLLNLSARPFVYLDGYWQCERYFADVAEVIRKEFTFHADHDAENCEWAARIGEVNAVALHARRLHGVPNKKNAQPKAGIRSLDLQYYLSAMQEISREVNNPHFFCFSDYPEWFKENLRTDFPVTFVTHNQYGADRTHEDFWLMSQCKHFIISNSTFSWWAAWLSTFPSKIVVAPDLSFWECKDVIPPTWRIRTGA